MNCVNHPGVEHVAFCQICGRPLCGECVRPEGQAVYCEQDYAARTGAVPPPPSGAGYGVPPAGAVPPPPGTPNPGVAALLGLIPGVGAMYNGQFAKGIVHLAIFAVLVSIADRHDIFGLFVVGWVFYQAIEAHQTAKARRDGTQLPNPFGFNDIGDRMGFGKTWGSGAAVPPQPYVNPQAPPAPAWDWNQGWREVKSDVQQAWESRQAYQQPSAAAPPPYPPPPSSPYPPPASPYETYGQSVPPVPPIPPFDPGPAATGPRFPMGAIWLIALGIVFLLSSSHILPGLHLRTMWPLVLIGLGIWVFLQRSGFGALHNDGSATYRWNLIHALRKGGLLIFVGAIGLLVESGLMRWGTVWPLFLIYFGVFALAERSAASQMAAEVYASNNAAPVEPPPPAAVDDSLSITPRTDYSDKEEGR